MDRIPREWKFVLLVLAAVFTAAVEAHERLVLVGGGSTPPAALARFSEWAGGKKASYLIITWPGNEPQGSLEWMEEELAPFHPKAVVGAPFAPEMAVPEQKARFLSQLEEATGVFFTGGDQNRAMDVMKDPEVLKALRTSYEEGTVFGGTSAGTAIMSPIMITGEGNLTVVDWTEVRTREGLGLLPGVILDQHFLKRQRENRLMGLIAHYTDELGVGIDQDNALAVEDNRFAEAFGPTHVMIIDGREVPGKLTSELLRAGDRYDLVERRKL